MSYVEVLKSIAAKKALLEQAPSSGTASALLDVVPAPAPAVERFRSVMGQYQANADASVAVEIDRITSLPIIPEPTEEEIDLVSKWYAPGGGFRLFPEQVKAMIQYHAVGSLIAPVSVGGGKTAISVLVANDAFYLFGKKKILLIEPSHLIDQLRYRELPKYRRHISINVPFYWLAGETARRRKALAESQRFGVYVVSYSLLSREDGAEIMDAIAPDLVIGDEIHRIASANPSARGRRFKEIVKKFQPNIVGLSGTITTKSPRDYHFLVTSALREYSFVPRPNYLADEWAKIIDTNANNIDQFAAGERPQPGPYLKVVDWAKAAFPKEKIQLGTTKTKTTPYTKDIVGFRRAHNKRMQTCPGVVCSNGADLVGSSLRISNLHITKAEKESCPGWEALQEKVKQLTELWIAPNGDEIEYALHIWRYRYELEGIGGYNDLSWPTVEKLSERRKITVREADEVLMRSQHQHNLHQEYARILRSWIKNKAKTGMDTPMLIGQEMYRNGAMNVGGEIFDAWTKERGAIFPEIVEREKSFVRLCPFRINRIVKWAKGFRKESPNKGALVWYDNIGVGLWLRDALQEADMPYAFCQANPTGKAELKRIQQEEEYKKEYFLILTANAFQEGLNIQHKYSAGAYAQWDRSARTAEQTLGRLHRPGQLDDEVRVFYSISSEFDHVNLAACLNDSAYVHQTTGKQKLMIADYDETPKILPYSVLVEWNAEPEGGSSGRGSDEAAKVLREKFTEKRDNQ